MLFLLALVAFSDSIPYPLVMTADDVGTPEGIFLSRPAAVVYTNERAFVADIESRRVFVIPKQGDVWTFAKAGEGPGELRQTPQAMGVTADGLIWVIGFNYLETNYFRRDGTFVRREGVASANRGLDQFNLRRNADVTKPHLFTDVGSDCQVVKWEGDDDMERHISRPYLAKAGPDHYVVAKHVGIVEIYAAGCHQVAEMELNLDRFKIEPMADRASTLISRNQTALKGMKAYKFGTPVIDVAAASPNLVWLLIRNEPRETAGGKKTPMGYIMPNPEPTWLMALDPLGRKIHFTIELDAHYSTISYADGHLCLASSYNASIRVYAVEAPVSP